MKSKSGGKSVRKRAEVKDLPKPKKNLTRQETKKVRGGTGINRVVVTDGHIK